VLFRSVDTAAEQPICATNVSYVEYVRRWIERMHFRAHQTRWRDLEKGGMTA